MSHPAPRLLILLTCAAPLVMPAGARAAGPDGIPVGIPACDTFLHAYRQCAASPGIPDAVRPAILQGIEQMGSSFRDAASNDRARRTLAGQCVQAHAAVRQSLVQSFKCDFPAPEGVAADAGAAPAAGMPAADPQDQKDRQDLAKANAWTEAQNSLASRRPMERDLASYLQGTERMPKPGAKPNPNNWYDFGISSFDNTIAKLRAAAALPGAVPGVDGAGGALLAALEALNPIVKGLDRYQTTREFKEDNYRFAREQHPLLVSGMRAAIAAAGTFGDALFERGMARDERRVESLPKGSLAQRLLATSLSARRAVRLHDALRPRADTAPLLAALAELSGNTKALLATLDATSRADGGCASFAGDMDTMVGSGRDLARDIRGGDSPALASERFIGAYNKGVDHMARCGRDTDR